MLIRRVDRQQPNGSMLVVAERTVGHIGVTRDLCDPHNN